MAVSAESTGAPPGVLSVSRAVGLAGPGGGGAPALAGFGMVTLLLLVGGVGGAV